MSPFPSHVHHGIDQNPMEFFFPPGRKGREQSRKAKVLRISIPYFEQNTQTNPMSVRGEPAATRFIVCNFTLPSP